MDDPAPLIVLCTCPDEVSMAIARGLVEHKLAACVNCLRGITSVYRWGGEVCEDAETLLVIKTTTTGYPALEARIRELHPYEVPEIIAVPISQGLPAYLKWLQEAVDTSSHEAGAVAGE